MAEPLKVGDRVRDALGHDGVIIRIYPDEGSAVIEMPTNGAASAFCPVR